MALPDPHFLINFKASDGTAACAGLELLAEISTVSEETGASFVVAPQIADLSLTAYESEVPVVAQVADVGEDGNGRVPIRTVAASGADGVLLNHPENEISLSAIERGVKECSTNEIASIVCVNSIAMGRAVLEFEPDWLLFERPDDIASGQSLAEVEPERLEEFVSMVYEKRPQSRVMVGGGISDGNAVQEALRCGADAAGAASAFINAADRKAWLRDVAAALSTD